MQRPRRRQDFLCGTALRGNRLSGQPSLEDCCAHLLVQIWILSAPSKRHRDSGSKHHAEPWPARQDGNVAEHFRQRAFDDFFFDNLWRDVFASLHFSPRGEAKCVRGPSGRRVSRAEEKGALRRKDLIAPFGPRVTKHGLSGSSAVRHFFWSEPVLRPWFSRITRHETRITAFSSCASAVGCGEMQATSAPMGAEIVRLRLDDVVADRAIFSPKKSP